MTETAPNASGGNPLDQFLCFSVYAAGLAFNRVYKPLLDPYGITYPQYLALVALSSKEGQTVSELGEKLHLESNTLTPLVKRLEAAGLVTRTRDTQDERVVRLGLTVAGSNLAKTALGCVPAEVLAATGMDQAALEELNGNLATLGATLRDFAGR
ncbi:MarR family transcriptional regulator [Porphyrobacter sp. SLTP]|uniref:MarR family winged helix-turn-helix transcriptional regulator n=1 Tax=Porphyrobacter sp. SLTP TaxID=2683266 RepID=UPI0014129D65|nr:MarR family transcriptional regulator [Porphyrobacter sp. SLTP]NBB23559.1 MarR family transcriptional regulator [Porphyrobacter sp. SLTP]